MSVWFDPYNTSHCKAYRHLQKTGAWPDGFELLDVEHFSAGIWQVAIMSKLANAWLDQKLGVENAQISEKTKCVT